MPITPFIGVRISWLIVARKALFACVAASASSRARSSSVTYRAFSIAVAANAAKASAVLRAQRCRSRARTSRASASRSAGRPDEQRNRHPGLDAPRRGILECANASRRR